MQEQILNFIATLIITLIVIFSIIHIAELIGRAQIYTDKKLREQLNICLEENETFQDCYHGIYDKYANFKGKNN